MTDQPPGQKTGHKRFCNELKNFFWSESIAGRVKHITGVVLLGGGVCYVPWLTSDALSPDYPPLRVWLVLFGILLLLAHIASTIIEKDPKLTTPTSVVALLLFVGIASGVWWKRAHFVRTLPHFKFVISADGSPDPPLDLTDSFLAYHVSNPVNPNSLRGEFGWLVLQMKTNQHDIGLTFGVFNNSDVPARYVEVTVLLPEGWNCTPSSGWKGLRHNLGLVGKTESGTIVTNGGFHGWIYVVDEMLTNRGEFLPEIKVSPKSSLKFDDFVCIYTSTPESQGDGVMLRTVFLPSSGPTLIKPFIARTTSVSNKTGFFLPSTNFIKSP